MNWRRACWVWLLIVLAESLHGVLRQWLLVPRLGDLVARQWGVLSGALIIFLIACATVRWIGAQRLKQQLQLGLLWSVLMLAFELVLGMALGYPRERLLADYRPDQGGYMAFGLLFLCLAPALAARLRGAD